MNKFFISLGFLIAGVLHASATDIAGQMPMKISLVEPWKDTSIKFVVSSSATKGEQDGKIDALKVKKAVYELIPRPDPAKESSIFTVLDITDPQTGKRCFIDGPEDFYTSDASGIRGFTLGPGVLVWSSNYLAVSDFQTNEPSGLLFERIFDYEKRKTELDKRTRENRITLRGVLPQYYFSSAPAAGSGQVVPVIQSIGLNENILQIQMMNPETRVPAQIWVDLTSREVTKTVVDGHEASSGLMTPGKEAANQFVKITDLKHTRWEQTSVRILGSNVFSSNQVPALVSNCEIVTKRNGKQSRDLIAFISKDKSQSYFGPKLDFYIQSSDKIIGFIFGIGPTLLWAENVLTNSPTSITNVLDLTKSATASVDMDKLASFYDNKGEETGLIRAFSMWAFMNGPHGSTISPKNKIVEAAVEANLLKIKIENAPSDFHGEAWIDLTTKELVRAIESGKVVFPK